jgi:hypothetical protein
LLAAGAPGNIRARKFKHQISGVLFCSPRHETIIAKQFSAALNIVFLAPV